MKREEVECCEELFVHDQKVREVLKEMPAEETLKELADFYKVFGDATRVKILFVLLQAEMCVCDLAEADEAGKKPQRWQDGILFAGRRSYTEYHQSGNGTYFRVIYI